MRRSLPTLSVPLVTLAVAASAASVADAEPQPVRTSSLAGTASAPRQDLRNADRRVVTSFAVVPAAGASGRDHSSGGESPLIYLAPGLALVAMLGAATVYARPRRPHAHA